MGSPVPVTAGARPLLLQPVSRKRFGLVGSQACGAGGRILPARLPSGPKGIRSSERGRDRRYRLNPLASLEPNDETARFDKSRLAKESKYPLKIPLLFFSSVIGGKGLTDALATVMKVSAGIRGATLDPVFLGIDAVCVALGLGVGYWTWTTMSDKASSGSNSGAPQAPAVDLAPLMLQVPPGDDQDQGGAAGVAVGDLAGDWVLVAGPQAVLEPSLRTLQEGTNDIRVLPWVLGNGPWVSGDVENKLLSVAGGSEAKEGWEAYVAFQVGAAEAQGVDMTKQAIVLLVGDGGAVKQKRVAKAPEGVMWDELLKV